MMQVEPLGSTDCGSASMITSAANIRESTSSSSASSDAMTKQQQELLKKDSVGSNNIVKQAITPINGKTSLLKFLSSAKSGVFQTIGDRIVVPMKVTTPTIQPASSTGAKHNIASTFRMAVPVSKSSFPEKTLNHSPAARKLIPIKTRPLNGEIKRNLLTDKHVIVKTECDTDSGFQTNDHNKFVKTMQRTVLKPVKHQLLDDDFFSTLRKSSINSSSFKLDEQDDELTSLSWLSSDNKELLKTIRRCNPDDPGIGLSGDENDDENLGSKKLIFTATSPINPQNSMSGQSCNDFKYNPLCKPPYSFSCLIFMAIEDSYLKRLPVKAIYNWVCKHFPYYRSAPSGWKNSIRHNLSLNRCFRKADCSKLTPKGSLWCIDPAYRPNLVQALKRSPYYPYLHPTGRGQPLSLSNLANLLPGAYTGRVPSWTPALPPSTLWADRDMASAALNLMGLRGSDSATTNKAELISNTLEEIFRDADWLTDDKRRQRCNSTDSVGDEELVVYGEPQDHCYAMAPPSKKKIKREEKRCKSPQSDKSAPDAAYEFESAELSDEFADEVIFDVAEDVVVDDVDPAEDQSLFDSGFGSMKSFAVRDKHNSPKKKTAEKSPSKRKSPRIKPLSNPNLPRAKRNASKSQRSAKTTTTSQLPASKSRIPAKVRRISREKSSDVDSGKDSPKVVRTSRSRRLKQRSFRKNNKSNYHTRSSGFKLLGQKEANRKFTIQKRKRRQSLKSDATDDEEVKLAAGSLMRLAGLLNSPTSPK